MPSRRESTRTQHTHPSRLICKQVRSTYIDIWTLRKIGKPLMYILACWVYYYSAASRLHSNWQWLTTSNTAVNCRDKRSLTRKKQRNKSNETKAQMVTADGRRVGDQTSCVKRCATGTVGKSTMKTLMGVHKWRTEREGKGKSRGYRAVNSLRERGPREPTASIRKARWEWHRRCNNCKKRKAVEIPRIPKIPKIPNPPVDELRDSFDLTLHEERVIYILTYQSRIQLPQRSRCCGGEAFVKRMAGRFKTDNSE